MATLITGGTGYIGSHTAVSLLEQGYELVVVDNLSNSNAGVIKNIEEITNKTVKFYCGDVCDASLVNKIFMENSIDNVIHFAGLKAVGESVTNPLKYYTNNLLSTLNLLTIMEENKCKNLVFSSSATVYRGDALTLFDELATLGAESLAIEEDFPLETTNPYGTTKLMIEKVLNDIYKASKGWNIIVLRYFNPIGAHLSGLIGEDPKGMPNNLVPMIIKVVNKELPYLKVFGGDYPTQDGTAIRDYIHIMDIADGHIKSLENLSRQCGLKIYNLGTGKGHSVIDLIKTFEIITAQKIPYKVVSRREGDVAISYANPTRAEKELGWKAEFSLQEMCKSAWDWGKKSKF